MELQLKRILMSTVEMRAEVHQMIDEIDSPLLEAIHAMLGTYKKRQEEDTIIGYETDGTAVTASVFLEQAEIAIAEAKAGKGITVEELEKRSEQWLARIR